MSLFFKYASPMSIQKDRKIGSWYNISDISLVKNHECVECVLMYVCGCGYQCLYMNIYE